jgi:uncharacterized protein (TIGR02444 family)
MAESLWDFATRVYARPGVAAACLQAQDEHAVDVTFLLAAAWAAARDLALDAGVVAAWDADCRGWREQVVQVLRRQRRAWASGAGRDYEALKALELAAEREMLARLEAALEGRGHSAARAAPADGDVAARTEANLAAVLSFFSAPAGIAPALVRLICG